MSPRTRPPTRDELLSEYDRLSRLMVKAGLELTVTDAVLDVFDDGMLRALIRDCVTRLIRVRALELER
jgi:hypothetical protein